METTVVGAVVLSVESIVELSVEGTVVGARCTFRGNYCCLPLYFQWKVLLFVPLYFRWKLLLLVPLYCRWKVLLLVPLYFQWTTTVVGAVVLSSGNHCCCNVVLSVESVAAVELSVEGTVVGPLLYCRWKLLLLVLLYLSVETTVVGAVVLSVETTVVAACCTFSGKYCCWYTLYFRGKWTFS